MREEKMVRHTVWRRNTVWRRTTWSHWCPSGKIDCTNMTNDMINMTNDMITLVSKWENRLHPPNPSDKKNYSVWPTS